MPFVILMTGSIATIGVGVSLVLADYLARELRALFLFTKSFQDEDL